MNFANPPGLNHTTVNEICCPIQNEGGKACRGEHILSLSVNGVEVGTPNKHDLENVFIQPQP